jgi:hypothetical protein
VNRNASRKENPNVSLLDKLLGNNSAPQPDPPESDPIVAYRCWKLVESSEGVPVLYSVVQDFCWLPFEPAHGEVDANPDDPNSPENRHGGIYAYKSPEQLATYWDVDCIAGAVNLWGSVLEHDEGYRAEFAYPKELWVNKEFDATMILRLEEAYGVPVVIKEDLPVIVTPPPPPPMKFTSGVQRGIMEIVRDVVYDREALTGLMRLHMFCRPIGMAVKNASGKQIMKSWERTNMVQAGMLQAPNRFVIKAIRSLFLESDGRPVPVTDPIYWETTIDLRINMKTYWRSPVAYVADPVILLAGTDWSKIPAAERLNLINCLTSPLTTPLTPIPGTSSSCAVDGVVIEKQMYFDVQMDTQEQWADREVLVALEGVTGRAIL